MYIHENGARALKKERKKEKKEKANAGRGKRIANAGRFALPKRTHTVNEFINFTYVLLMLCVRHPKQKRKPIDNIFRLIGPPVCILCRVTH